MGSRAENDLYTTESFIKEPLSWGFEKDELCNDSAVQERRASEGVLIDDDKDWVQSPSLRRCSLVSERVQGSGKGSSTILTAGGEGGAAAGPHRRGFIAFGGESLCQLHVCSESDMRSETGNWIQLGQQVLKLEDLAQVPEHIESKAYEELGETPEVRKESLQQFKCMLDTQPCYLMKMLLNLVLSDMIPGLQKECSKVLMGNMDCLEHQVAHLKTVGGTSLTGAIINILKRTLTNDNDVAEVFSLLGRKTKNFKEYPLYKVVFAAVRVHHKDATEKEIDPVIEC